MRMRIIDTVSIMALAFSAGAALLPTTARADIYVTNLAGGTIGRYTNSGAVVNASLVSGLSSPCSIAVAGSNLFVLNSGSGTVGEYTTSGAVVNASLLSGLNGYGSIDVSGSNLFVSNYNSGTIGEYTMSGGVVNASLISGLYYPTGIAISGSSLFVQSALKTIDGVNHGGMIARYTTSGALVNPAVAPGEGSFQMGGYSWGIAVSGSSLFTANKDYGFIGQVSTSGWDHGGISPWLVSGLRNGPEGIAASGSNLFVGNFYNGTVGEYTTSGATVNAALISGLNGPWGIAVTPAAPPLTPPSTASGTVSSGTSATVTVASAGSSGSMDATFHNVTAAGVLTVTQGITTAADLTTSGNAYGAGPVTFKLPTASDAVQVWDVNFTGTFSGTAGLVFHFDPTGLSPSDFAKLRIEHYTGGQWVELAGTVDAVNDTITVNTTSFSPFALGMEASTIPLPSAAWAGLAMFPVVWLSRRRNQRT